MDDIIVLFKSINDGYEITSVKEDGNVEIKKSNSNDKKIIHIDFMKDLKQVLDDAFEKMKYVYDKEKNNMFCVRYRNHDFYSFDLYMDIIIMLKHNKIKKLSIYEKYEQMIKTSKETKEKLTIQAILDELEKKKNKIDLNDISSTIIDERNIISFDLIHKSNFQIGETRFFSEDIDINESIEFPNYLEFVGQINLEEISKYDENNLLPKKGMLYFYQSPLSYNDKYYVFGKVVYDPSSENMVRKKITISENEQKQSFGITNIKNRNEKFSDRYRIENGKEIYSFFEGEELNKIFGFYTDCQMNEENIKRVSNKYIILLQLGSQIYGEGVTTFLITEKDLKNKNFDNVIYQYVQS